MTEPNEETAITKPTAPPEEEAAARWPTGVRFWVEEVGWSPRVVVVPVGAPVRVGRSHAAELPVSDPEVSRFHAVLWASGRSVTVADHQSRNGTFLRGVRVGEAVEVEPGAAIQIGDTVLVRAASSSRPARAGWVKRETLAESPRLVALTAEAVRALRGASLLWVEGEPGSGRGEVAAAAHRASGRAGALARVDCAALAEHELLRALRGREARDGDGPAEPALLEQARGGTLLVEGLEALAPEAQVAAGAAIGDALAASGDALRVIVTTRRAPPGARGVVVAVPPLRARVDEVCALARSLLDAAGDPRPLGRGVEEALRAHAWPGNVRELRDAIGFARSLATGDRIERDDLPRAVLEPAAHDAAALSVRDAELEAFERNAVVLALTASGSLSGAAAALEVPRAALRHTIARLGLDPRALGVRE